MLVVYTKTGCPWRRQVLDFLHGRKISFEEREVLGNPIYYKELLAKSHQSLTPTLDLDGELLADADAAAVEKFLRERGIIK